MGRHSKPRRSMRRRMMPNDDGTAALELTLLLIAMIAIVALSAPLAVLLIKQTKLERAAGVAARFATQIPDRSRPGSVGRKPTDAEVVTAATSAADSAGISTTAPGWSTPTVSRTNGTVPGSSVSVRLSTVVPLSGFASILSVVGLAPDSVTITATAVGRQE